LEWLLWLLGLGYHSVIWMNKHVVYTSKALDLGGLIEGENG